MWAPIQGQEGVRIQRDFLYFCSMEAPRRTIYTYLVVYVS